MAEWTTCCSSTSDPWASSRPSQPGTTLTGVEWQTQKYVAGVPETYKPPVLPLPFAYESTGVETRFTNTADPEPRSRRVFWFHRPETLASWLRDIQEGPVKTLRHGLQDMPPLDATGLWPAQVRAITNLEESLREDRPRALIQMATGSGKTFTAANTAYRVVKNAGARRVLFLVDRANLGRQTLKEFQQFVTPDDGRKFTELYNVQHLASNRIDPVARVCISTIQRLYSILKGEADLDPELDEHSIYEIEPAAPLPVEYNPAVPPETFDVVIVDECHRSIYGLWRQVLEYFDAFLIGLTATPSKQTFGFFNQNLVMEYTHEQAVADNVNVDFDVYRIRTEITEHGGTVDAGVVTSFRNRQTKQLRWEQLDEPLAYEANQLDRAVVAKDQIRTVIRTFKERLFTDIFPGGTDVPKTLIFAKDDAHADDIVQIVREEFGKGNDWAVKITYRTTGKADDLIAAFRNSPLPRVAVTVDMIATGTDVKPLECLLFMRSVRSRTFFEQMKGRGVRVMNETDFQAVTPDAKAKTHFVIVDAVGVTETDLNDTQPLDRKPGWSFEKLLKQVSWGNREPDVVSTLASRIARLEKQITKADREELEEAAGVPLVALTEALVSAVDPDRHFVAAQQATGKEDPTEGEVAAAAEALLDEAVKPIAENAEFRTKLLEVRRSYEQTIDETSKDVVLEAGHSKDATDRAKAVVASFRQFIEEHKDEITALADHVQPSVQGAADLQRDQGTGPRHRTSAAAVDAGAPVARVRGPRQVEGPRVGWTDADRHRVAGAVHAGPGPGTGSVLGRGGGAVRGVAGGAERAGRTFTDEQMAWLERIRDVVASSLAVRVEDFDYTPFVEHGGLGRATEVFGEEFSGLLRELSEVLTA